MSYLSSPHFHDEKAAYAFVESRVWANGRVCPHCKTVGRSSVMKGKSTRIGAYKCYACRKPFTVKVGTVFESSHVKLNLWLQAIYLMAASKKGISSNQLHRTLGVTLKTAWFMSHRIREAMRSGSFRPFGGEGGIVEADETYYGKVEEPLKERTTGQKFGHSKAGRGPANKRAIVSLVERGGEVRSFHIPRADKVTVTKIVRENIAKESRLHTDRSRLYRGSEEHFLTHETVDHGAKEYARGDVHNNSCEGYFSIFKRGMKGVYQKCDEKHLHRYLAEFDFRYNKRIRLGWDDKARADELLCGIVGKRLTYETTRARA
ncbi:MAG: IS1595 family transposase [Ponticaulis sp.]|nr:IS1595 family transposase [Ponticaulis sp.]